MPPAQYALLDACRTLFGDEISLGPEFLAYLQLSGAKVAFRSQAKQNHPDRFASAPPEVRAYQTAVFREIHQAYQLLTNYLERRHSRPVPAPHQQRRKGPGSTTPPAASRNVPPMPMEFGIFAFYQGKIDYRDLIDALVWQRRQRPTVGTIACQWGWLTEEKVRRIMGHHGSGGRFGRKAVELGMLTPLQVEALLRHQRNRQQRLGQFFIERGLMNQVEADHLAKELERHNLRFASRRG